MAMNAIDLAMASQEFGCELAGAAVIAAAETPFYSVVILFETPDGRRLKLLISANDRFSRVHLVEKEVKPAKPPLPFGATLEKRLAFARVEKVEVKRGDRVFKICFFTGQKIVAELTGVHANIFLVEADGRIAAAMRRNRSNKRDLSAGSKYEESFDAPSRDKVVSPTVPSELTAKHAFFCFAAEEYYGAMEASFESERLAKGLAAAINDKIKKAKKAKESALADLEDKKRLCETRKLADALAAGLYSIKRGASEAALYDLETGEPLYIKLDPSVSPQENLNKLYAKAAKGNRGVVIIRRRLVEIEERENVWTKRREDFNARVKSSSLDAITKWLIDNNLAEEARGVLRRGERATVSANVRAREKRASLFREFVSATGVKLLVGRSDKVNDRLTFGTLKKDDFWFHAAGTAGPHVAAPMREKNKTLDDETLIDACTLAAKFAGFKAGDEVEIIYARRKELNKPGKHAKPGAVVVSKPKYKTVILSEERLRRLLKKDE